MNVRKHTDYGAMFATLDMLMAANLPQMKLYVEIGRLVSTRPEKGAAVAAAEYLCGAYPNASGFSPRNLRRMRDFYRTYENAPETLAQAMTIGWTQNVAILEAILTLQERAWYIRAAGRFGWSKLELQRKIIANTHMDSVLNFSDTVCYTEENSATADPQKTWQEGNAMADKIKICGARVHNLKNIDVDVPLGKIVGIAGVSGSGKTTLILESLMPGLEAAIQGKALSEYVLSVEAEGIRQFKLIDATPIGINVRSTVATYANFHDELRKLFARTPDAKAHGYKAGDFSYNTGSLRCPTCDRTGVINLDVQFLPDVDIPCPDCGGSRYSREAGRVILRCKQGGAFSLPQLMDMDVNTALEACPEARPSG
ncbi:MAG: ATP-binding cassette domain-containing protein [Lachnospiraceae bacterium]|nr:ATP-binding cassette domain-containing protein [Lachnospiraceae bacterium]